MRSLPPPGACGRARSTALPVDRRGARAWQKPGSPLAKAGFATGVQICKVSQSTTIRGLAFRANAATARSTDSKPRPARSAP